MNMRDFWAKEAAAMRDTSYLGINVPNDNVYDDHKDNLIDSSGLKQPHHKTAWDTFLSTKTGHAFVESVQKTGVKVMLILRSANLNADGRTSVYEGFNSRNKGLNEADKNTLISNGVTIVVENAARAEQNSINTFGHEIFVHVKRTLERLSHINRLVEARKLKTGADEYIKLVRAAGYLECADHKRLAMGNVPLYRQLSEEIDSLKSTDKYLNMYNLDVKGHERYKNRNCDD